MRLGYSCVDAPGVCCSRDYPVLHGGLEAIPWADDLQPQRDPAISREVHQAVGALTQELTVLASTGCAKSST